MDQNNVKGNDPEEEKWGSHNRSTIEKGGLCGGGGERTYKMGIGGDVRPSPKGKKRDGGVWYQSPQKT